MMIQSGNRFPTFSRISLTAFVGFLFLAFSGCDSPESSTNIPASPKPDTSHSTPSQPVNPPEITCGMIDFEENGKFGYMNCKGEIVVEAKYDGVGTFDKVNGIGIVHLGEGWGLVNEKGKELLPIGYSYIRDLREGRVGVLDTLRKGFILTDKHGKVLNSYIMNPIWEFSNGVGAGQTKDGLVIFDTTGKEFFRIPEGRPASIRSFDMVREGRIALWVDKYVGYWDLEGNQITATKYQQGKPFFEGRAAVQFKGKWGFIDASGKEIIPPVYEEVHRFDGGVTAVLERKNGKEGWYIMDRMGNKVSEVPFTYLEEFHFGVTWAAREGKYGLINSKGIGVTLPEFDLIGAEQDGGYFLTQKGGMTGLIDASGKTIVPFDFKMIMPFADGFAPAQKVEKWGVIDRTGKTIIPFEYEDVTIYDRGIFRGKSLDSLFYFNASGSKIYSREL